MNTKKGTAIKTAFEIGALAEKLSIQNQLYVLNTINTLLFSQNTNIEENETNSQQPTNQTDM